MGASFSEGLYGGALILQLRIWASSFFFDFGSKTEGLGFRVRLQGFSKLVHALASQGPGSTPQRSPQF